MIISRLKIKRLKHSFEARSGLTGQPGAGTGPG